MRDDKPLFAILTIDGGGIRGIIPASVLVALEGLLGRPIAHMFDLIVGTSTGGKITLAITHTRDGKTPAFTAQQVLDLYTNQDNDLLLFDPTLPWIGDPLGSPPPIEWALRNAKYRGESVRAFLQSLFGSATLGQALTPVSCVSFKMDAPPGPWFFRSWEATGPGRDFALVDVARASGAAPVYYPPAGITSTDGKFSGLFADGGVCANDPAVVALAEATTMLRARGDNIDNYHVWLVSLGTGATTLTIAPGDNGIYGWFEGGGHLVSVLMDGPVYVTCETVPILLHRMGGTYTRVQVPLTGSGYTCSQNIDNFTEDNLNNLLLAGQAAASSKELRDAVTQLGPRLKRVASRQNP